MTGDTNIATPSPNFQSSIAFELLFNELPPTPVESLIAALGAKASGNSFEVAGHRFQLKVAPFPDHTVRDASLQQSWNWKEAGHVLGHCTAVLSLSDEASDWTDYRERVSSFRRVLAAAIRTLNPLAVHAPASQQFLAPAWLAEALEDETGDELFGFINIRLYKFEGHERGIEAEYDETVMDTLGLGTLGLPDLQAHFKHLDPSLVAELLYGTAQYVFEKGPVIESGHQLQGFLPDQKWTCQLEESITEPLRLVLDLNPGRPYSAGSR
jgi:hypothetical protein